MAHSTVFQRFSEVAQRRGAAPFLMVMDETAQIYSIAAGEVSYAEMAARVASWAQAFADAGYGAGHRVGLLLQNRPAYVEIWLALNALGASVVPINPDLRLAELEYLAAHSEMVLAIVLPERADEMRQAAANAKLALPVILLGDPLPRPARAAQVNAALTAASECALLYTSGTTGQPKGCLLSNEYFLHSGDWYAKTGGHISLRPDCERMLTPLPVFHMNAMAVSVMAMITVGGCLILLDRFHPSTWWQSVRDSRATVVHYLGVMPTMLSGAPASANDRDHSVRFGFGAGVDKKLHAPFEARFGFPLIEAWAMTETGSGGVICAHDEPRKIGSSCFGRAAPEIEARVVDDAGQEVPAGLPGELLVRRAGANPRYGFFSGYLKNQSATDEVWQGGWFHTGDIVLRDAEDGAFHFVDRKKNVIRRSGENIAAVEVETILNRHPDIRMVAAAATPDATRGDEVAVVVVLNTGEGSAERAEEIVRWGLEQMAYYKVPGWVSFVPELPLTATQKILRGKVKDLVDALMQKGSFYDTRALKRRRT